VGSASPQNPPGPDTAPSPRPAPGARHSAETAAKDDHPSGDNRFKMLDASMKRQRYQGDALIEILHTAQELFGYVQTDLLLYIANVLKLPPSRVYGVATFYHFFTFTPKGEHTCTVCTGTACYVKGADALLAAIQERTGALPGRTTDDGRVSLETARCLGACGLAPIVVLDGEVCGKLTPAQVLERIGSWDEPPALAAYAKGGDEHGPE